MNKCQSPVAQQSTRFLHCVTGSARKDNSTFGIVWNLCQIATWKYYGWAHIFFLGPTLFYSFFWLEPTWWKCQFCKGINISKVASLSRSHNSVIVCWQSMCPSSTVSHAQPDWVRAKLIRPDACKPTGQIMCTASCILPIDSPRFAYCFCRAGKQLEMKPCT